MPSKIKIGGHVINTDAIAHIDDPYRAQADAARRKELHEQGHADRQGYTDNAVRIQFGNGVGDVTLFGDEAQAFRDHLGDDVDDITPESSKRSPEDAAADAIANEVDATIGKSGITDADRLAAATSAGQDRPGAADLRPAGAKTTPPPGTAPDAEPIVPSRTAGLHATPAEAKGLVDAAATVKADDDRRAKEARERAEGEKPAAAPKYPSDRAGEASKDEPGKPIDSPRGGKR